MGLVLVVLNLVEDNPAMYSNHATHKPKYHTLSTSITQGRDAIIHKIQEIHSKPSLMHFIHAMIHAKSKTNFRCMRSDPILVCTRIKP